METQQRFTNREKTTPSSPKQLPKILIVMTTVKDSDGGSSEKQQQSKEQPEEEEVNEDDFVEISVTPPDDGSRNVTTTRTSNSENEAVDQSSSDNSKDKSESPRKRMEALEIEDPESAILTKTENTENVVVDIGDDDELDDDDDDMEGLLETQKGTRRTKRMKGTVRAADPVTRCCTSQRIGNTTVFWPHMYKKTGWGMMGKFN